MSLKKDAIKKLKDLGFDTNKLFEAIKADDEVDFTIPEINNLSDEDLAERDKNTIAAAKKDIFKEGKDAGIEIANKAIIKKFNLENVDTKDVDKVITAIETTVAKGDTGLKEQIALLQKDKDRIEAEKGDAIKKVEQAALDRELITYFPKNRLDVLTDDEYLDTVKKNLSIETIDGVKVVKKGDTVLRDKTTQAPIPVKDAISSFFTDRKFISTDNKGGGGRGGDDNSGGGTGGIKKYSQAEAQFIKDNPEGNLMSPAFTNYVAKIAKETTDFDYDA
jgi:hypothetical protein